MTKKTTDNNNENAKQTSSLSKEQSQTNPSSTQVQKTSSQEKTKQSNHSTPTKFNWAMIIAIFAAILAIIAVIEATLYWRNQSQWQAKSETQVTNLTTANQTQQTKLEKLNEQFKQNQQTLKQQQELIKATNKSIQQLTDINSANNVYWNLLEVGHIFRLANLSLFYSHDIPGTIALLENANQRLQALSDPSLLQLQQSITNKILTLKEVPKISLTNILMHINAVKNKIPNLPLALQQTSKEKTKEQTSSPTFSIHNWRESLKQSWHAIEDMVVIRHQSSNIQPLITPREQNNLIHNIQLQLGQAQWAAMQNKQQLYKASLEQANKWIKEFFLQQSDATQTVITELNTLSAINIAPKLPSLTDIQKQLNTIINARRIQQFKQAEKRHSDHTKKNNEKKS